MDFRKMCLKRTALLELLNVRKQKARGRKNNFSQNKHGMVIPPEKGRSMKRFKKMMALVIAIAMVLSMSIAAFAEDAATPSGALTVDPKISITGLQDGDTVQFYKVLKWDNGWKLADGFTLTDSELATVVGDKTTKGAISSTIAGKLGTQAASANVKYSKTAASGKAEVESPEAGLYIAIITPAKTGYTYNPVFVGADYKQNTSGDSSTWNVTTDLSYSDTAIAKKSEVTVDKTAVDKTSFDTNKQETVGVGDTVVFTVKTVIPGFADNYTKPVFKVTDALSTGLQLDASKITLVKPAGLTKDTEYTVTPDGTKGFTVAFKDTYLKTVKTATDVEITYEAKVTSEAPKSVNHEDNTVTVNYSNSPSDEVGHGTLKDKTNHYTFNIDGDLFGEQPYKATEVVKVGVDKDGNEITQTVTLANGKTVGALQGAEFKLFKNETCTEEYSNDKFSNPIITDEQGRMTIKGLDAGKYWVKETKAPDGYIADTNAHSIEIKAEVEEVTVTEGEGDDAISYKTNVLKSYTVEIDGHQTASYSITNNATTTMIVEQSKGDTVVGTDTTTGKIKNTQGVELPSTGGIGTTIFYIIGAILVLGAGVVMVTRRRMEA